ncbi:U3 small nucleolar RNA-interacting protein 2 [Anopheles darlingi]|uniref:U3 small nucleolar RNA-interacting protein 2 n=1 Tax=Anopheles darlingi TaxID=43151 RepID=UPI0021002F10|nr:U3 small nucleolar RNA-interacting protein 2 [Anopheles darlingi]XP_049540535.1 U3 small nucleolar RNA-interacting protein 2 [Anopheles darlingi]XP_049540623.1 U3 small nucleolar RNA-interacting protein 2 [Anopheles darlingi]
MSLFKTGRRKNEKFQKKRGAGSAPKASAGAKPEKVARIRSVADDTIDSDEEMAKEAREPSQRVLEEEDFMALETAQDKRVRLAKDYLRQLRADEENNDGEADEHIDLESRVGRTLKGQYLNETGKIHRQLADKCCGFRASEIFMLRCKQQRLSPTCLCVAPNDEALYVGCKSGFVIRWDLATRKRTATFSAKHQIIRSIAVSHDARYLVVADGTADIKVLDGVSLAEVNCLRGHSAAVTGVAFRQHTYQLFSASDDRTVKVWSLDEMVYIETLYGHQNSVSGIDALALERVVTAGGMDRTVRVWKVPEESQLVFSTVEEDFSAVRFVSNDLFLSGSIEGSVCLWSCGKKKPLRRLELAHGQQDAGHPNWISAIGVLPNSDLAASGSCDGFVRVWRLADRRRSIEPLLEVPVVGFVNAIEFTHDGRFLIVAVGQEHRLGRWWTLRNARNRVLVVPLSITE